MLRSFRSISQKWDCRQESQLGETATFQNISHPEMYSNLNTTPGAWRKWSYLGAQRERSKCVPEGERAPVTWRVNKEMNFYKRWELVVSKRVLLLDKAQQEGLCQGTKHERGGKGRNLGNMGRGCWWVATAALPHLEKDHTNFVENSTV